MKRPAPQALQEVKPVESVHLTIDDRPAAVPPGASVLDAARRIGLDIPTLCSHPQLKPSGACRMCVVEIDGLRGFPTACTTLAADGMKVHTATPALQDLRREIFQLILSEHPYTCLVCGRQTECPEWQQTIRKAAVTTGCENCPKNGQCELQELARKIGLSEIPFPIHYRGLPVEKDDPFFDRDYNLCILCGRCVRVCQDVRLTGTLAFVARGPQALVGTAFGKSHLESDCEFCGSCVDVCPTGALFDKRTKWEGPAESSGEVVCPYCSVGCRLEIRTKRGRIVGVLPAADGPANMGQACVRGRFGLVELVHAENRVPSPLIRRDGRLVEAGWDEALSLAAEKLSALHGAAFALLGSPHLTSEAAFVLGRFAREAIKSRNVDCSAALPPAHTPAGKLNPLPAATIESVRRAKCIVVIGANPRLSHPVVAVAIRQAVRDGAHLIVFDPRETELARRADLWIRVQPGGDAALLESLAKSGGRKLPEVTEASRMMRDNTPAVFVYGSGVTDYPHAAETILAIQHAAAGNNPPAGILPLVGPANAMGMARAGLAAGPGDHGYLEIAAGIEKGKIRALYTVGAVAPLPGLATLDLLIVQDLTLAPHLEEHADIVFPAASFAEAAGTMTNLEGREQSWDPVLPPFASSRPDWQIPALLAVKMGTPGFEYTDIEAVRLAMRAMAPAKNARRPISAGSATKLRKPKGSFLLIAERNAFAYRGFSLTEGIRGMAEVKSDEDRVILHPQDAASLGIAEHDEVQIESAYGADTRLAHLSAEVPAGIAAASINPVEGSPIFPGLAAREKAVVVRLTKADGKGH